MIKKFFAELVVNFQPRMNLGKKRFNEESATKSRLNEKRERVEEAEVAEKRKRKWVEPPLPTEPQETKEA